MSHAEAAVAGRAGATGDGVTVGIDVGTTSVKGVAVDASGRVVDRIRLPHPLRVPAPDRFEHDARRAWRAGPRRAFAALAHHRPRAVAVASMVPSLTAVDRSGRPVAPGLLYGDGRGRNGDEAGESLGFLRWLAGEVPAAAGFWPAPAVANRALGGPAVVDVGTAVASSPLFGTDGWDEGILETCGVPRDALPDVAGMGDQVGRVAGADVVLASGAVDGLCEQLVAGADEVGDVLAVCGTTLLVWVVTAGAVRAPGLWSVPHLPSGRWAVGGASNAGALFVDWAARLLRPRRATAGIDPHDVPVWVPYVRGERTPVHDPERRASLHGLTLRHDAAAVERAAWEASGFVLRHHVELAGVTARRVVAAGGGTRSPGWMQALADCTGLPVHVSAVPEGAAVGAAWLARKALGEADGPSGASWARTGRVVEPDPEWAAAAATRYALFRSLAGGPP